MPERVCADNEGILNHNLYCLNHFHILCGIVVCADDKNAAKLHAALKSWTAVNATIIISKQNRKEEKSLLSPVLRVFVMSDESSNHFGLYGIRQNIFPFSFYAFMRVLCLHKWVDHKLEHVGNFLILGNSGKSLPLKILSLMRHTKWTWLSEQGTRAKHSISVG